MAKFNLAVFKKGKPIYWVGGAVIIFALFYLFFNRGSGGTTQVVQSGPSEATQIANAQLQAQMAIAQGQISLEANRSANELAAAGLAAQVSLAQIQAAENTTKLGYEKDAAVAFANIDANKQIAFLTAQTQVDSARIAAESALAAKSIDASLLIHQIDTNAALFKIQSDNLITQSLIATIPSLKSKDRDKALRQIAELNYAPELYTPVIPQGGGFSLGGVAGGVAGLLT